MKKRTIALLLAVVMLFAMIPVVAQADTSGTCGDNLTWSFDSSTGTLSISGTGAMENYGYAGPWGSNITNVVIEDGVTSIGDGAFFLCTGLTSVTIPSSVTSIGESAFKNCTNLTSVTISGEVRPDQLAEIKTQLLNGGVSSEVCDSIQYDPMPELDSGTCGDNLSYVLYNDGTLIISGTGDMDDYNYYNGNNHHPWYPYDLTNVVIEDGVTSIGDFAFYECRSLESVTFEENSQLTSIGREAFYGCESLTSIEIPSNVTSIGDWAFEFCYELTSVTIPSSVTSIGYDTFLSCEGLTSVTISGDVTEEQLANIITQLQEANAPYNVYNDTTGTNLIYTLVVEPDATILGMNGVFGDYFVLNVYVQTDAENPTFAATRAVSDGEVVQVDTKTEFCLANKAVFYVEKVANNGTNKLGLKSTRSEECWMVSIKFFTQYLNDPVTISMKDGDETLKIAGYRYEKENVGAFGNNDALTEQSYSFIDYLTVMKLYLGAESNHGKLCDRLTDAAALAKAIKNGEN